MKSVASNSIKLSMLMIAFVFLSGCLHYVWPPTSWSGYSYPAGDSEDVTLEGLFISKQECMDWALEMDGDDGRIFGCGKKCKVDKKTKDVICREAVDFGEDE